MNTDQIAYPVFVFDKERTGTFDIRQNEIALVTTTPLTIKSGIHDRSLIVDVSGHCYEILSVDRGFKGKLLNLMDDVANRPITIKMELSGTRGEMTRDELVSRILVAFQDQSFCDVWESTGSNIFAIRSFVQNAQSISDVATYLLDLTN